MNQTTRNKCHRTRQKNHPWMVALFFVLGLAIHPFCIEWSEHFLSPAQEVFLLLTSGLLTLFMFLLAKSHYLCSLLQAGGLLSNVVVYIIGHSELGWDRLLKKPDYEWCFRIILMWCSGVAITMLIRLFAKHKWNAPHIRRSFRKGFMCSSIVFSILYIILLLALFIFQRTPTEKARSLNLIPFHGAFSLYWPHIKAGRFQDGIFVQFFGNLLIFTPLGFYLGLWWRRRKHKWVMFLLPVLLSGTIEACQYLFHTGESDIDDLWMNVIGFLLGVLMVKVMDAIRSAVTKGKEKTIFS